jgi:hypothetical protein
VLFDSRFGSSRALGAAAARGGYATAALQGDVTALWVRDLEPHWAAGGGAIAGMTTAASLFCLEQLAKDHWMRVIVRVDHRRSPGGGISHRVTAVEPMVARVCAALTSGAVAGTSRWPDALLHSLSARTPSKNQPRFTRIICAEERRECSSGDADLVSWVIAKS